MQENHTQNQHNGLNLTNQPQRGQVQTSSLTIIQKYKRKTPTDVNVDKAITTNHLLQHQESNSLISGFHQEETDISGVNSHNRGYLNANQVDNGNRCDQFNDSIKVLVMRILIVLVIVWFLSLAYRMFKQTSVKDYSKHNELDLLNELSDQQYAKSANLQQGQQPKMSKNIQTQKQHKNSINFQIIKEDSQEQQETQQLQTMTIQKIKKKNDNHITKSDEVQQSSKSSNEAKQKYSKQIASYKKGNIKSSNIEKKLQMALKFWMINKYSNDKTEQGQELKQFARQQLDYYQNKYQISKFGQVEVCILLFGQNFQQNQQYKKNLDSIFQQNYTNYQVYFIDNLSTDKTNGLVQNYIHDNKLSNKLKIYRSKIKGSKFQRLFTVGQQNCHPGSIMMVLDGKDQLIGRQVFKLLSAVYQSRGASYVYTQNVYINQPIKTINQGNNFKFPFQIISNANYREGNLIGQLKTWVSDLFLQTKKESVHFSYNLSPVAEQVGLSFALMQKAGTKVQFVNQFVYKKQISSKISQKEEIQSKEQIEQYRKLQKQVPFSQPIKLKIKQLSQLYPNGIQNLQMALGVKSFQQEINLYYFDNQEEGIRQKLKRTLKYWMINWKNSKQNQQLKKYANQEKQYFQQKYKILQYAEAQICVLVTSYMNEQNNRYKKNLDSIFQQEYQNYMVYYVDDFSQDRTGELVQNYMIRKSLQNKMKLYRNKVHQGKAANQFILGNQNCKPGSIIIFIDGDDQLIGKQVFKLLNAVFQKHNIYYVHSQHVMINQQKKIMRRGNSQQISDQTIQSSDYRKSSLPNHLRSWVSDIFLDIKKEDILYEGDFPGHSQQFALNFALLQKAGTRISFLNQYIYKLSQNTGVNYMFYDKRSKKQAQNYYRRMKKLPSYEKSIELNIKQSQGVSKANLPQKYTKIDESISKTSQNFKVLSQDQITIKKLHFILKFWQTNGKDYVQNSTSKNILRLQKDYYQQKYFISKYAQIEICVVVLGYNDQGSDRYIKNLDSIFQQFYMNYKVYYVDDFSTDSTANLVQKYITERKLQDKVKIIKNSMRKGKLKNLFQIGKQNCKPGSIMMSIDGKDELIGRQVFSLLNAAYQSKDLYYLYTQNVIIQEDKNTIQEGQSKNLTQQTINNVDYRKSWIPKQLSTWTSDLFLDINMADLLYKDKFPLFGEDLVLHFLLMEKAGRKVGFLNQHVYKFVKETDLNDQQHSIAKNQIQQYYRALPKYSIYNKSISFRFDLSQTKQKSYISDIKLYKLDNQEQSIRSKLNQTLKYWLMTGRNTSQNKDLMKFAEQQKKYFQQKYQISQYGEMQICVVVLSYMNEVNNRYKRNLDSIFQQQYENFNVYYVDDFSQDKTGQLVEKYIKDNNLQNKMKLFRNTVHKRKSENQFFTGQENCEPGSIMIVVDGDDELIGKQVFKFVNAAYQKYNLYYLYSQHVIVEQTKSSIKRGFSQEISSQTIQNLDYRKSYIPSHLRCWMSDLFLDMKKEDIFYKGDFPGPAEDVGLNFLMMEKAGKRVKYINQYVYRYAWDTGLNNYRHRDIQVATQQYYRSLNKWSVYQKPITYNIKKTVKLQATNQLQNNLSIQQKHLNQNDKVQQDSDNILAQLPK